MRSCAEHDVHDRQPDQRHRVHVHRGRAERRRLVRPEPELGARASRRGARPARRRRRSSSATARCARRGRRRRQTGSPITSYTLEISPTPPSGSATVTSATTSYTFTGLKNGTAYTVRVRAHNKAPDPGPWSDSSQPMIPAAVPDAPVVTATRSSVGPVGPQINVVVDRARRARRRRARVRALDRRRHAGPARRGDARPTLLAAPSAATRTRSRSGRPTRRARRRGARTPARRGASRRRPRRPPLGRRTRRPSRGGPAPSPSRGVRPPTPAVPA